MTRFDALLNYVINFLQFFLDSFISLSKLFCFFLLQIHTTDNSLWHRLLFIMKTGAKIIAFCGRLDGNKISTALSFKAQTGFSIESERRKLILMHKMCSPFLCAIFIFNKKFITINYFIKIWQYTFVNFPLSLFLCYSNLAQWHIIKWWKYEEAILDELFVRTSSVVKVSINSILFGRLCLSSTRDKKPSLLEFSFCSLSSVPA